ncbi:unnamed protein product [Closterium sp. NIES-65]|nr:unnamed protein product [Closterium sp. NIES-65]
MQCAGERGVSASVQRGDLVWGGKSQSVQWKHGVTPGMITLACPLKPSVPPSTIGRIEVKSNLPSGKYSRGAEGGETGGAGGVEEGGGGTR